MKGLPHSATGLSLPAGRVDPPSSCSRSLARYVPRRGGQGGSLLGSGSRAPSAPAAGPCSAAWPSSGRPGRRGSGRRSTACTTTASAGATAASSAPTSMTPTRWPCAPGARPPCAQGLGALPRSSQALLTPSCVRPQVCPGHVQEDGWDLPLLPQGVQGEGEWPGPMGHPDFIASCPLHLGTGDRWWNGEPLRVTLP